MEKKGGTHLDKEIQFQQKIDLVVEDHAHQLVAY